MSILVRKRATRNEAPREEIWSLGAPQAMGEPMPDDRVDAGIEQQNLKGVSRAAGSRCATQATSCGSSGHRPREAPSRSSACVTDAHADAPAPVAMPLRTPRSARHVGAPERTIFAAARDAWRAREPAAAVRDRYRRRVRRTGGDRRERRNACRSRPCCAVRASRDRSPDRSRASFSRPRRECRIHA